MVQITLQSGQTYTMSANGRKSPRFRDRPYKGSIGGGRSTCSIGRSSTRVISKEGLDVRIGTRILAKLMLPVKTKPKILSAQIMTTSFC